MCFDILNKNILKEIKISYELLDIVFIINSDIELEILTKNPLIKENTPNIIICYTKSDLKKLSDKKIVFINEIDFFKKIFSYTKKKRVLILKPFEVIKENINFSKLEEKSYFLKVKEINKNQQVDNNITFEKRLLYYKNQNSIKEDFIDITIENYFSNFNELEKCKFDYYFNKYNFESKFMEVLLYLTKKDLVINLEKIFENIDKYTFSNYQKEKLDLYIQITKKFLNKNIIKAKSFLEQGLEEFPKSLVLNDLKSDYYLINEEFESFIEIQRKIINIIEGNDFYLFEEIPQSFFSYKPYFKLGKIFYKKKEFLFSEFYFEKCVSKFELEENILIKVKTYLKNCNRELKDSKNQHILSSYIENDKDFLENYQINNLNQKNILICNTGCRESTYAIESLLSVSLMLRKVNVHVFVCDKTLKACELAENYNIDEYENFAEFGHLRNECEHCFLYSKSTFLPQNVKIHYYSDYVSEEEKEFIDLIVENTNIEDIRRFEYKGVNIGEHAYSGVLRFFARGDLEKTEYSKRILKRYFHSALFTFVSTQNLFNNNRFETCITNHGIYIPFGVIGEVCRKNNIRVVNWGTGYKVKSLIFSHEDTYHKTLIKEDVENWENIQFNEYLEEKTMKYLSSRFTGVNDWINFHNKKDTKEVEQLEKLFGIDFKKPCIALLTNVIWDAQLHFEESIFENMMDWIIQTVKYFETRKDLQLIIRVHPAEITGLIPSKQRIKDQLIKEFVKFPPNIFIIDSKININTYKLVRKCNSAIIYGTKMGIELPSYEIPVIVAGNSWVREKGITIDPKTKKEYFSILNELPFKSKMEKEKVLKARKYAFHYFFRRMIPINCIEYESLNKNKNFYRLNLKSLKELLPGNFKGLDIICEGIINNSEFIYPAENYPQELEKLN